MGSTLKDSSRSPSCCSYVKVNDTYKRDSNTQVNKELFLDSQISQISN